MFGTNRNPFSKYLFTINIEISKKWWKFTHNDLYRNFHDLIWFLQTFPLDDLFFCKTNLVDLVVFHAFSEKKILLWGDPLFSEKAAAIMAPKKMEWRQDLLLSLVHTHMSSIQKNALQSEKLNFLSWWSSFYTLPKQITSLIGRLVWKWDDHFTAVAVTT